MITMDDDTGIAIEAVDELPRRLRPHKLDPAVDRILNEVPVGGWYRVSTDNPKALRARLSARGIKVEARRYPLEPRNLYIRRCL